MGILVPTSNKLLKCSIIFNSDETGFKTIWEMQEVWNAWLGTLGFKTEIYLTNMLGESISEIVIAFQRKSEDEAPKQVDTSQAARDLLKAHEKADRTEVKEVKKPNLNTLMNLLGKGRIK